MIVVDTSALMAIILGEPEREAYLEILDKSTGVALSSGTMIEILLVSHSRGSEKLGAEVEALVASFDIEIVPPGLAEIEAAHDGLVRFGKGSGHPARLNFGDLFSYALAKSRNLPLLFKGDDFSQTDLESAA